VIQSLRHEIPGLVAVVPDGGKVARAQAVSPQVQSGNVYLPHPAIAPWVEAFVEELANFPNVQISASAPGSSIWVFFFGKARSTMR
jgi:predicted phage terminase large subunit-like protein